MIGAFCAAEGYGVALFGIDDEMPFDGWSRFDDAGAAARS
jgi:hypothetical protein